MATVTCSRVCYYYVNDVLQNSLTVTYPESGLISGGTYTPSDSKHMPPYDGNYTLSKITYNEADYTSQPMVCPSSDFIVEYHFYRYLTVPKWTISNYGRDYVDVEVTSVGGFSHFSFSVTNVNGTVIDSSAYSMSTTRTLSGLSPNTKYYISCSWSTSTTGMGFYNSKDFTTKEAVAKWNWSNVSNGTAAYNAVTGNGKITNFKYTVWNALVDKINEAAENNWDSTYATYSATKMSSSDKTLTATRFNSARHNIGLRVSTGISEVEAGDTVYGWYFTTLADCLNAWIDSM